MNPKKITRRSVLAGIIGFGTTSVSNKTAAQQSTSQDGWHRYQYDNQNSGYNPDTSGPRSGVGIEWSKEVGGSDLISDGESIYISYSDVILKYSIEECENEWEYSTNTETQFKPLTYAEGSIYAIGRNSILYEIDAGTGEKNWEFQIPQSVESEFVFHSAPQYSDGMVYMRAEVGVEENEDESFCRVLAIDTEEREIIWETEIPYNGGASAPHTAPAIGDESIYAGAVSISKSNGEIEWESQNEEHYENAFASLYDNQVFVGYGNGVAAFNKNSGEINWSTSDFDAIAGPTVQTTPAVDGNRVYYSRVTYQDDSLRGNVVALNITDGNQVWQFEHSGYPLGAPIIGNNTIYIQSSDNNLYAIDSDSGNELWRFDQTNVSDSFSENSVPVDRIVSGNSLLVSDRDSIFRLSSAAASGGSSNGGTTIFRRFRGDSVLPIGVIGGGILGGIGIAAYRRLQSDTDDATSVSANTNSEETAIAESSSSKPVEEEGYTESTYTDYEQDVELRQTEYLNVTVASIDDYADVAFYTSAHNNSETIDKALADELASGFETWSKVDDHENILTVYQHSDTPTSWAAVELADYMFDPADFADELVVTKRNLIVDLCNAVYEGHRYGLAHGGLGVSTFVVETDGTPTLKVGDWGVTDAVINNNADQSSDIDHVVDIAFELFTSESPAAADIDSITYPDGLESVFETAWDDGEGYETVIHFRDAILEAI